MLTLEDKVANHHQEEQCRVLKRRYSYDEAGQHTEDIGSENMVLRGYNSEALKDMLLRYECKVKCIYIDPPYNTGEEGWKYTNTVDAPAIKNMLSEVVDKEGGDPSQHGKLLYMMYPA